MDSSDVVSIGIFSCGLVFGIIGWLLVRVIKSLDKTIVKIDNNQARMSDVMSEMQERTLENERRITILETVHKIKGCDTGEVLHG